MVDIPGYEGKYAITEDGKIYSYRSKKFINPYIDDHGYRRVDLGDKKYRIHVLLGRIFIPNPENLPTIDHIDRNKLNNDLTNLRWADRKTQVENQDHNCHEVRKKKILQINKETKMIIKEWESITEAAKALNIDSSSITKVALNKRKSAGDYIWRYKE